MRRILVTLALSLLLAGCSDVATPPLEARLETRAVPESALFPGLTARGTLGEHGDGFAISAVARNDGDRTYRVETGCSDPWQEVLFRGNDTVPMRRPAGSCAAFTLTDFGPGSERTFDVAWDGRVWDEATERLVPAEPGNYTWAVRFIAYLPDGATARRLDLEFDVNVLPD